MVSLSQVLQCLYPNSIPLIDWVVQDDGNVPYIKEWKLGVAQPTQTEIDAAAREAQAALDAAAADQTRYQAERADLKAQFDTAAARLAQIRDAASPTNPQVVQAVRDLATYQLKILKYIRKL